MILASFRAVPNGWLRLLLLSAALVAVGCGVPPPASRMPSADAALERMRATNACVNGVQGTAKIDNFSPEGRVRGEVHVFAVNPDRVRFDVASPFGVMLVVLTSNGKTFEMLDVRNKQYLHGPAAACNLARLTRIPLPGHVLVSILRGEAPVLVHEPKDATIEWDDEGFYRLVIASAHDASEEVHLEVHPDDLQKPWSAQRMRVTQVRVTQRGVDLYHVDLGEHDAAATAPPRLDPDGLDDPVLPSGGACAAELPRAIHMNVPNTDSDVILQYKDAKWNPPLVDGAFTQPVPGGVQKIFVDCPNP